MKFREIRALIWPIFMVLISASLTVAILVKPDILNFVDGFLSRGVNRLLLSLLILFWVIRRVFAWLLGPPLGGESQSKYNPGVRSRLRAVSVDEYMLGAKGEWQPDAFQGFESADEGRVIVSIHRAGRLSNVVHGVVTVMDIFAVSTPKGKEGLESDWNLVMQDLSVYAEGISSGGRGNQ